MAKRKTQPKPDLSHITERLRPLAVPIDSIFEDPANANTHGARSIRAIMGSLNRYGQRTPLVVNTGGNIVAKGNGTLEAARRLGWEQIAVVFVEDDPLTHTGYSIADNRTSEFSQWDETALMKLLDQIEAEDSGAPVLEMWNEVEVAALLADIEDGTPPSLDDLENEFGEPSKEDFWPVIRVKVSPDTYTLYETLMDYAPGEDEGEKFNALMGAVDETIFGDVGG
jgi:hypothetical protein